MFRRVNARSTNARSLKGQAKTLSEFDISAGLYRPSMRHTYQVFPTQGAPYVTNYRPSHTLSIRLLMLAGISVPNAKQMNSAEP